MSDGNEAHDQAAVSRVSDGNEAHETEPAETRHEPVIQVLKGEPTAEDLAALVAVLGAAGGGGEPAPSESTRWGLPVDNLRYGPFSWQKITLLERIHMRR